MSTKSKFKLFKVFINIILLGCLGVVLYQNNQAVQVELLAWKVEVSLTFLLMGIALLGALITFLTVVWIGKN